MQNVRQSLTGNSRLIRSLEYCEAYQPDTFTPVFSCQSYGALTSLDNDFRDEDAVVDGDFRYQIRV